MKAFTVMLCAALLGAALPAQTARADAVVSIDYFYDSLAPYGDWVYVDGYGYTFVPAVAYDDPGWYPYSDGYWAYTPAGWTWISYEDWGWATYHYGRWIRVHHRWHWVPGYDWAPAWVSWRWSDSHVGWAPLPPEARWSMRVGFSSWTDSYYDVGPAYYNFVPVNLFVRRGSLRPYIIDRSTNITYIDRSVNVTNITYQQNVVNNIFVGGPDVAQVERLAGGQVRRLDLRRDDTRFQRQLATGADAQRADRTAFSRIEGDQLVVAAPTVKQDDRPRLPEKVRERIERPEIDRGWRDVNNPQLAEKYRRKQHEEMVKTAPKELPAKEPVVVTSTVPPPAVGRVLKPQERLGAVERPDPSRIEEEVRKAKPESPGMKPREAPGQPGVAETPPASPGLERKPGGKRPDLTPGVAEKTPPQPRLMPPGKATAEDDADRKKPVARIPGGKKVEDTPPSAPTAEPPTRMPAPPVEPPRVERAVPEGRPSLPERPTLPQVRPMPKARPVLPEQGRPALPEGLPMQKARPVLPDQERPSLPKPRTLPDARTSLPPPERPKLPEARPALPTPERPRLPEAPPAPKKRSNLPGDERPNLPQARSIPKAMQPEVSPRVAFSVPEVRSTPRIAAPQVQPRMAAPKQPTPVPRVAPQPKPAAPQVQVRPLAPVPQRPLKPVPATVEDEKKKKVR